MWIEHKEMENYEDDMRTLMGHAMDHISAGRDMAVYMSTKEALTERFGWYDEELWDDIEFVIVDQLGVEMAFDYVNRRVPMYEIFKMFVEDQEEDHFKYQFTLGGKLIANQEEFPGEDDNLVDAVTPIRIGMENGDAIQANRVDKVAVSLRSSSASREVLERSYLADKTDMISKTFEEYARDVLDTDRVGLVFLLGGKRIFGFESPVPLGFERRGNVVDVVPVESYKCERCECCNPEIHPGL